MNDGLINSDEYSAYYQPYIDKVQHLNIVEGLRQNLDFGVEFYSKIPKEKENYIYAKGKWTIKDILLHIIDCERILAYRALRIARSDKTILPSFNQDDFVANGFAKDRSMESLLDEYKAVRRATITLFDSFSSTTLSINNGLSESPFSVRALGFIIIGHENHHIKIIKELYLKDCNNQKLLK